MITTDFLISRFKHFKEEGYINLYKAIFGTPQFPVWFLIQAIWSCYVVHRSCLRKKKTPSLLLRNFVLGFAMTFGPRELFAYLFHKLSPISHNPISVLIFLGVYITMTFCPYDLVYKIINAFYYFVGFAQGANQTRLFTLILRTVKGLDLVYLVPIALTFTIMDQLLELIFRPFLSGAETKMSNGATLFRTLIFSTLFWLATYQNLMTKFIGKYSVHITALALSFSLGLFNAAAVLNFDNI